jgi:RNA polymerase-associated protein CTR9
VDQKTVDHHYRDDKSTLIAIFNSLAAHYTRVARLIPAVSNEKTRKTSTFNLATNLFNKADNIDAREEITWVGKGVMMLFRGDFDKAAKQFVTVLGQNPHNLPALVGRASVLFHQGQYDQACAIYKKVVVVSFYSFCIVAC